MRKTYSIKLKDVNISIEYVFMTQIRRSGVFLSFFGYILVIMTQEVFLAKWSIIFTGLFLKEDFTAL